MPICTDRPTTGRTTHETILDALCRTMPQTAAASGLCSIVDVTPVVGRLFAAYGDEKLATRTRDDLGLTYLTEWLAARGEVVSRTVAKELRDRLIAEALRRNVVNGNAQFVHVRLA